MVHAAIDLDGLGICQLPAGLADDLMFRNLASVWANYRAAGVTRLLLAEAVASAADLDRIRDAVPNAEVVVGRLTTSLETAQHRVRLREPGMLQDKFVARVPELERILDDGDLEDFSIENEHVSVTDVAREMLIRAGWL